MADVNEIVSKSAIKGVERLETATKQTAKQVQALYDVSKKLDTVMKGLDLSTKNAKKNQETLSNAQKQAIKINKEKIQIRKKVLDLEDKNVQSLMRAKQGLQQSTNETKKAIEVERSKTAAWKKSQKATEQSTVAINKSKQTIKLQAKANDAAKGSYNKLAAQLSINTAEYKALSSVQQKSVQGQALIKKIQDQEKALKKLNIELKGISVSTKKAKEPQVKLTDAQRKANRIIKLQATANAAAKGSYDKLAAQLSLNIAKYKALSSAQQKASKGQTLIKNIQKQDKELKRLNKTMGRSQGFVGAYGEGFTKAFAKVGLAIAGVVAAARMLQRVVGGSIKVFKVWETGQANVQTLLDKTDKTLESRSIALMKKHGLAVDDLNKALFDAVSAGIESGKAVDFLDKASVLAIAGVTDLASSVDGITSILNAYGLEVNETDKITAAFFSAQKFGKTTVAELTQEVGRTAPVAKLAGLSYQELLSTYAELTKQGIKTVDATTAIKATILAVIKPSEIARKKFNELGIEVGANAVKQQGLMSILQKVSAAAKTDADALTELIPNVRALTGVGALGTEALKDYDKILKIVNEDYGEGSSMAKGYAIQSETLAKKTDRFNATIRALSIAFGAKLKPILIEFMGVAGDVGSWFTKNLETILAVVKIIGMATGAWLIYKGAMFAWAKGTILVNAVTKTAKSVQIAYNTAVGKSTGIVKKAIAIQKALKAAMISTPWGAIAAAIGLVVGALVVFSKRAKGATQELGELAKGVVDEKAKVNTLVKSITTLNEGSYERMRLLKELNEKYPDLFKNIDIEKITNKELEQTLIDVNEQYLKKIKLAIKSDEIVEAEKKTTAAYLEQGKGLDNITKLYMKYVENVKEGASEEEKINALRVISGEKAKSANILTLNQAAKINDTLFEYRNLTEETNKSVAAGAALLSEKATIEKESNAIKDDTIKLDEMSADQLKNLTDEQLKHYDITRDRANELYEIKKKEAEANKELTAEEIANLEKIAAAKKRLETVGQKVDINETKRAGTERLIELQTQLQNESITQKEFDELKAESAYDTNIKILEQEAAFIVKALENKDLEASERLDLENQLAGKLLDSQKLLSDESLRIAKENKDEVLQAELLANQAAIEAAQQKVNDTNAALNANLLFQKQRYVQGLIDKKEYEAKIAQLEKDKNLKIIEGDISVMQTQKDILAKQLKNSELLPEQKKKINDGLVIVEENLAQLQMDLSDMVADRQIENIDKVAEKEKEAADAAGELAQLKQDTQIQLANAVFEFAQMISEKQLMTLNESTENQLAALEGNKARELELAGDDADQKTLIEEKYAAQKTRIEEEHAERAAKIRRRQAIAEKAQGILNIGINTLVAVMKTTATLGPILAAPLIPWIIAQGAIMASLIAAKPIPKFAKGVKSSPAGPAEVGEKGRELGVTPKGQAFIADEKQVVNLEKGTRIFNNKETEKILNTNTGNLGYDMSELNTPTGYNTLTAFNEMYTQLNSEGIIAAIGEGNDKLINTIKRKREFHFNSYKGTITERDGSYYKNYLNMKVKA